MKDLTVRQVAAVKRQFKNSLPALKKIESINKKIAELEDERAIQQAIIDGGEAGIMKMTGGYKSVDLIHCEYVPQFNEDGTPKMDKDGKYQIKNQVLTFVPPVEAIDNQPVGESVPNTADETANGGVPVEAETATEVAESVADSSANEPEFPFGNE